MTCDEGLFRARVRETAGPRYPSSDWDGATIGSPDLTSNASHPAQHLVAAQLIVGQSAYGRWSWTIDRGDGGYVFHVGGGFECERAARLAGEEHLATLEREAA